MVPLCHPLPVDAASLSFAYPDDRTVIIVAAVRATGQPTAAPARPGHRQRWLAGGLAGGAVIAASLVLTVQRDREILVPNAEAKFQLGDAVLVICRAELRKKIIKLVVG